MKLSNEQAGELYIVAEAVLWGLFPVVTILSLHSLPPLISLGISLIFSTVYFACVVTWRKKWRQLLYLS